MLPHLGVETGQQLPGCVLSFGVLKAGGTERGCAEPNLAGNAAVDSLREMEVISRSSPCVKSPKMPRA